MKDSSMGTYWIIPPTCPFSSRASLTRRPLAAIFASHLALWSPPSLTSSDQSSRQTQYTCSCSGDKEMICMTPPSSSFLLVRVGRVLGHLDRILGDELLEVLDGGLELGVLAVERGVRQIVDDDVRVDAVPLDEPLTLGPINARFRRRGDAAVDEDVRRAEPDLAAPGPCPDDLAQAEAPEAFAKGLAVRSRALVAQDDHVPAESVLHVPGRLADPVLPVEPGFAHELLEDPGIDVAAVVVADVDDQTLAVEDGIEVLDPLRVIGVAHGPQVDIADVALPGLLDLETAGVFPLSVAEVGLGVGRDGRDDLFAERPAGGRLDLEEDLLAGRVSQQKRGIGDAERRRPIDGGDDLAFADGRHRLAQWRQVVLVFGIGPIDVIDAIAALGLVADEARPQGAWGDVVGRLPDVATADERMQGRELADEVGQKVVELGAVTDPVDERTVALEQALIVDVVEIAVVEVVALHPPGVDEHLAPLLTGIDREGPLGQVDPPLGQRLRVRLGRSGVDDVDITALADEKLLPVGRELEIPDVLDEGLGLDIAVLDLDGLELGLAGGVRPLIDEEQDLLADREPGVDAGRERHLEDAVLESGDVDDDLRRRLGRFLGGLGGRRARLDLGRPLLGVALLFGLELRRRGEGERLLARQRGGIDLGRLVKIGFRLPRSPGAADGALKITVGKEVEPFACLLYTSDAA